MKESFMERIMATTGPLPELPHFPQPPKLVADNWELIFGYLTLPAMRNLIQVNKFFNAHLGVRLISVLQRLKKLDPRVRTNVTKTNFHQIAESASAVHNNQIAESKLFSDGQYQTFFRKNGLENTYERLQLIAKESSEAGISVLEERSQLLDDLNIALLKLRIKLKSTLLEVHISFLFPTRIPSKLLKAAEYQDYWKNLTAIDLSYNRIQFLPPEIGECSALQSLDCQGNQLQYLPPEIERCSELKILNCAKNWLLSLPPELAKCQQLATLEVTKNYLTEIPVAIQQKMGSEWTKHTLTNQASFKPGEIPKAFREVMFDRLASEEEKRAYYLQLAESKKATKRSFELSEEDAITPENTWNKLKK